MQKNQAEVAYRLLWWSGILFVLYSHIAGIGWGTPYPFHPDERNMVDGVMRMNPVNGYDPDFYAYGQLPLMLAYLLKPVVLWFGQGINEFGAIQLALRLVSAIASIVTVWLLYTTISLYVKDRLMQLASLWIAAAVPGAIQYAHYGTTESLLMLCSAGIAYAAAQLARCSSEKCTFYTLLVWIFFGVGVGSKVSFLVFGPVVLATSLLYSLLRKEKGSKSLQQWTPASAGMTQAKTDALFAFAKSASVSQHILPHERVQFVTAQNKEVVSLPKRIITTIHGGILSLIITFFCSPFYVLAYEKVRSSLQYESAVGFGTIIPFYTRQFIDTIPFVFQFIHVFPYTIGFLLFPLFFMVFFVKKDPFLWWLLLTVSFVSIVTLTSYAKWARFAAPLIPLITLSTLFALATLQSVLSRKKLLMVFGAVAVATTLQGWMVTAVYTTPDVRFMASDWMQSHIAPSSRILQETANTVDLPIHNPASNVFADNAYVSDSFNFYEVHTDAALRNQLESLVSSADYILVPSRRIFMNHTCYDNSLQKNPALKTGIYGFEDRKCSVLDRQFAAQNQYYDALFSGKLGFTQVATFTSNPRLTVFGKTILSYSDEMAEESISVFDHPTVRVFKRE